MAQKDSEKDLDTSNDLDQEAPGKEGEDSLEGTSIGALLHEADGSTSSTPKKSRIGIRVKIGLIIIILSVSLILISSFFSSNVTIVSIGSKNVNPKNNGKLVYIVGELSSKELTDPMFGISTTGLSLERVVEIYNIDGEAEGTWESDIISSLGEEEGLHDSNKFPIASESWTIENVQVGSFSLSPRLLDAISNAIALPLTQEDFNKLNAHGKKAFKLHEGKYYFSLDPQNPRDGDLRIGFKQTEAGPVTILAKQQKNNLVAYRDDTSVVEKIIRGKRSLEIMSKNIDAGGGTLKVWGMRGAGALLFIIGIFVLIGKKKNKKTDEDSGDFMEEEKEIVKNDSSFIDETEAPPVEEEQPVEEEAFEEEPTIEENTDDTQAFDSTINDAGEDDFVEEKSTAHEQPVNIDTAEPLAFETGSSEPPPTQTEEPTEDTPLPQPTFEPDNDLATPLDFEAPSTETEQPITEPSSEEGPPAMDTPSPEINPEINMGTDELPPLDDNPSYDGTLPDEIEMIGPETTSTEPEPLQTPEVSQEEESFEPVNLETDNSEALAEPETAPQSELPELPELDSQNDYSAELPDEIEVINNDTIVNPEETNGESFDTSEEPVAEDNNTSFDNANEEELYLPDDGDSDAYIVNEEETAVSPAQEPQEDANIGLAMTPEEEALISPDPSPVQNESNITEYENTPAPDVSNEDASTEEIAEQPTEENTEPTDTAPGGPPPLPKPSFLGGESNDSSFDIPNIPEDFDPAADMPKQEAPNNEEEDNIDVDEDMFNDPDDDEQSPFT